VLLKLYAYIISFWILKIRSALGAHLEHDGIYTGQNREAVPRLLKKATWKKNIQKISRLRPCSLAFDS
jgi:hypothetical protein